MQSYIRLLQLLAQLRKLRFQFTPALASVRNLQLGAFAAFDFFRQGLRQPLDPLQEVGLGRLQFICPRLEPGLFSAGTLLVRLKSLLVCLQLLLQLFGSSLQFAASLTDFIGVSLKPLATSALLTQRFH